MVLRSTFDRTHAAEGFFTYFISTVVRKIIVKDFESAERSAGALHVRDINHDVTESLRWV